jgi:hypothetical protein
VTSPTDIDFPADLDEQIEAALEALRSRLVDPSPDPTDRPIGLAMSVLSKLLATINPKGFELAESGILMQAVALKTIIYHIADFTPGDWFHESTADIKRALVAIELLLMYADQVELAKAAAAAAAKAADAEQNTKADV